jgi:hypothetical protein
MIEAPDMTTRMVGLLGSVTLALLASGACHKIPRLVDEAAKQAKAKAEKKRQFADKVAALDRRETGKFWSCVMASEVDIGMFSKVDHLERGLAAAYAARREAYPGYLTTECVPLLDRAAQAMAGLADVPAELAGPFGRYRASLPKLESGLASYAAGLTKQGAAGEDTDQLIQKLGTTWHTTPALTAETAAYERFLYCAVPGLSEMKDAQQVLVFLFEECKQKDAVAFMDRVRAQCGPLLVVADKGAKVSPKSVPSWKQSHQRFLEESMRQLQAFELCSKRSRKAQSAPSADFLAAANEYMAARAALAAAMRGMLAGSR